MFEYPYNSSLNPDPRPRACRFAAHVRVLVSAALNINEITSDYSSCRGARRRSSVFAVRAVHAARSREIGRHGGGPKNAYTLYAYLFALVVASEPHAGVLPPASSKWVPSSRTGTRQCRFNRGTGIVVRRIFL